MKISFKQLFANRRALPLLLIGLSAGLLLIFFGGGQEESTSLSVQEEKESTTIYQTAEEWARAQEAKITALLLTMSDIHTVSVAVMPASGSEYYYAQNGVTGDSSRTKEYVIIDRDGETPILVHEICPELRGIAVVAPGISDSTTYEIINLLGTLYDLSSNHIYVSR